MELLLLPLLLLPPGTITGLSLINSPSFHILLSEAIGAEVVGVTIDVNREHQAALRRQMAHQPHQGGAIC